MGQNDDKIGITPGTSDDEPARKAEAAQRLEDLTGKGMLSEDAHDKIAEAIESE